MRCHAKGSKAWATTERQAKGKGSLFAGHEGPDIDGAIPITGGPIGWSWGRGRAEMIHVVLEGVVCADIAAMQAVHGHAQLGQGVCCSMRSPIQFCLRQSRTQVITVDYLATC